MCNLYVELNSILNQVQKFLNLKICFITRTIVFLNQKNCAQIYTQRRSNFFIKSKLEPKVFFFQKITQHWLSLEREVGQIYLTLWIIFKIKKWFMVLVLKSELIIGNGFVGRVSLVVFLSHN